jgi:Putative zinc-finger
MLYSEQACLDEDTVLAFVSGDLPSAVLARVEQHLAQCESCFAIVAAAVHMALGSTAGSGDRVQEYTSATAAAAARLSEHDSARVSAARKRVGDVLRGKYRLDDVIGVGGMSAVYRATHRNRAEYAVKVLLPEHSANADVRRRFLLEGYAANSVKHSGAVLIIDDDVAEDGSAFWCWSCSKAWRATCSGLASLEASGSTPRSTWHCRRSTFSLRPTVTASSIAISSRPICSFCTTERSKCSTSG